MANSQLRRRALRRGYKRIKRGLVFQILRLTIAVIGLLPERLAWRVGAIIGAVAHLLARRDRARARHQLAIALPDRAAPAVTRAMFDHLGLTVVELALLSRDPTRAARWVELPEPSRDVLRRAVEDGRGRGVVAVSAHLGNWELLPQRLAREDGVHIATAARENANAALDRWIVALRARAGVRTISRGQGAQGAREILRALRSGDVFALLVDQDTRVQSVLAPFFGRQASTPVAAAELALRGARPLIAGFIRREGPGHHVIEIERLPVEGDVAQLTAAITLRIEHHVRAHPEQWVWFHRRWRRSPNAPAIDRP